MTVTATHWSINDRVISGGNLSVTLLGADGRETADMGDVRQLRITSKADAPVPRLVLIPGLGEGAGEAGVQNPEVFVLLVDRVLVPTHETVTADFTAEERYAIAVRNRHARATPEMRS